MIDNTINHDKTIAGGNDVILVGCYRIVRKLGIGVMLYQPTRTIVKEHVK